MSGIDRLTRLKLVVFDVDGVFTDGRSWQDSHGRWRRYFSVRDTMGIRALRKAGYKVAVLDSGLSNDAASEIAAHVSYVGVDDYIPACRDKSSVIGDLSARFGLDLSEVAFVTDNEDDRTIVSRVGFGVSVSTSSETLQEGSRFVTSKPGGDGAILEVCNLILQHGSSVRGVDGLSSTGV